MEEEKIDNNESSSEEVNSLAQEKREPILLFQIKGSFVLTDRDDQEVNSGQAKFILDEDKLSLFSEDGKSFLLLLREIKEYSAKDYHISLSFLGGGKMVVSQLGYDYDNFVKAFTKIRQEIIEKDLLMEEGGRKTKYRGRYEYQEGTKEYQGEAEVSVYDTGIIVRPSSEDLFRVAFAEIEDVTEEDYTLIIKTEYATLSLSHFGEEFHQLSQAIKQRLAELSFKTQEVLKRLMPDIDPLTIKSASELLRDGRAVSREAINRVSPSIWQELEKRLSSSKIRDAYSFLISIQRDDQSFIGIKRDLMGDLTEEYLWLLVPISSQDGQTFLVFESVPLTESGGKATYLFRTADEDINGLVKKFNRCLLAINFRREPIYLRDEDLERPDWAKYKTAISKIPELRLLRQLFVGRIVHQSNWQETLLRLIND